MNAFDHSVPELALGKRLGHQGNRKKRSKRSKKIRWRRHLPESEKHFIFRWWLSFSVREKKIIGRVFRFLPLHENAFFRCSGRSGNKKFPTAPRTFRGNETEDFFSGEIFFSDLAWHRAIEIETLLISDTRLKSSRSTGHVSSVL